MPDTTPTKSAGERLTAICTKLLEIIEQYPETLAVMASAIEGLLHEAEITKACSPIVIKRIRAQLEAMKQRHARPLPPLRPTRRP
jgi:hypothetical protein